MFPLWAAVINLTLILTNKVNLLLFNGLCLQFVDVCYKRLNGNDPVTPVLCLEIPVLQLITNTQINTLIEVGLYYFALISLSNVGHSYFACDLRILRTKLFES